MEYHYQNFVTYFQKFIVDLNRYCPSDELNELINIYESLDKKKIMESFYGNVNKYGKEITANNESIFNNNVVIFQGINLKSYWPQLISGQKKKVWIYLNMLLLECNMVIVQKDEKDKKEMAFNPYEGIGGDNANYGVNEMFSGLKTLDEDKPEKPGFGSIANMVGADKMLNMDKISEQLKNMKPEDIEQATLSIQNLLGSNADPQTSKLIGDMLSTIKGELNDGDISKGNPLDNIMKIAESVATKMKPNIEQEGIDMEGLLASTQNIANKCVDDKGNKLFNGQMDPMQMLRQMQSGKCGQLNINPQALAQAQNLLQQMGMGRIDLNKMQPKKK